MMKYFKTADPDDDSEGELSKRVRFLKCEEGVRDQMCELTEMIERRGEMRGEIKGEERGIKRSKKNTSCNLFQMGMSPEQIAQAVEEEVSVVREWIQGVKRTS